MSDHPQQPDDWGFPPAFNRYTDIVRQQPSTQGDHVTSFSDLPALPDSWNDQTSASLNPGDFSSLANSFPETFLPAMTSTILQPTPPVLEHGQSSRGKRKIDHEATPKLDRTQSEDMEVRAKEAKIKQIKDSTKRSRSAETHNISERNRRTRINDKIQALGHLLPNLKKTDIVSVLDETIVHLRSLKLQHHMMSIGRVPQFISPAGFQGFPQMPYFSPFIPMMRPGMPGMGVGFGTGYPPFYAFHPSMMVQPDLPLFHALNPSMTLQQLRETVPESIPFPAAVSEQRTSSAFNLQPPPPPCPEFGESSYQNMLGTISTSPQSVPITSQGQVGYFPERTPPAFNLQPPPSPEFGESNSQNIWRPIPVSSQSVPITSQGFTPLSTSYTVHATHIVTPTNLMDNWSAPPTNVMYNWPAEAPEFDEEGRQR